MRTLPWGAAVALALLFAAPTFGAAQERVDTQVRSDPTGLHFGLWLNGSAINFDGDPDNDAGPGLGLALGWAPSPVVTIFLSADGANVTDESEGLDYTLAHGDLGVRLNLHSPDRGWAPYLEGAFTARRADVELLGETFTVEGTGFTLGGGVGFFVRPGLAIDLGLLWTAGTFDEVSSGGLAGNIDEDATSARFRVGMRWWAR